MERPVEVDCARAEKYSSGDRGAQPLDSSIQLGADRGVQFRVCNRDTGHLELVARAQQRAIGERLAIGIGDDRAALLQADGRGRQVVGRVVQDRAAADPLELRADPGHVVDHPRARLDIGVELSGDHPGHVEGRGAEIEGAAADGRGVDQLCKHLDEGSCRPAPESVGPEHSLERAVLRETWRRLEARASLRDEALAALQLQHATDLHVAHRRLRVEPGGGHGDARRLQAGQCRARAVDRVDDQHPLRGGAGRGDHSAVLRVEGDLRGPLCQERFHPRLGALVDVEGYVTALGGAGVSTAGVCAEVRENLLAQGRREVRDQFADLHYPDTSAGRDPSVTSTWACCPPRRMSSLTVSPGLWSAISSERSLFWKTGLPSTRITTSPPVLTCGTWKVVSPLDPLSPALSAGLPPTTSVISAPLLASMPRWSASCG